MPSFRDLPSIYIILGGLLSAAIFLFGAWHVLQNGHLHEDAYILLIYSENLARLHEIVYFPDGPRTEGATDFLWMLAIAGLTALGINSAIAAALLNTLGAFVIGACVVRAANLRGNLPLLALVAVLTVPLMRFSLAGYGGFSTPLYCAVALLLFHLIYRGNADRFWLIPIIAIVMGLLRPDGVIFGAVATLSALLILPAQFRRGYFIAGGFAAAVGIAYFVWRFSYFGEVLPLPLLVKSKAPGLLPGLETNLAFLNLSAPLLFLALLAGLLSENLKRLLVALLPAAALFLALSFSLQSQNVDLRFQGPMIVILFYLSVEAVANLIESVERRRFALSIFFTATFIALISQPAAKTLEKRFAYLKDSTYINYFPIDLAKQTPGEFKLALTEAGRMAYWMPAETIDLVGLNSASTARGGATVEIIDAFGPDLIFVHLAGTTEFPCDVARYCEIPSSEFLAGLSGLPEKTEWSDLKRTTQAPLAVLDFLSGRTDDFHIVSVYYVNGFKHLYALRRDSELSYGAFVGALERSLDPNLAVSYLDAVRAGAIDARFSAR